MNKIINNETTINLGHVGESGALNVIYDLSNLEEALKGCTVVAFHKQEGEENPYPIPLVVTDNQAIWTVTNSDTSRAVKGEIEFQFIKDGILLKSDRKKTYVMNAMNGTDEPLPAPTPIERWEEEVTKKIEHIDKSIEVTEELVEEARECRDDSEGFAKTADDKAEEAKKSAQEAEKSAKNAKNSEENAEKSAEEAKKAEDNTNKLVEEFDEHVEEAKEEVSDVTKRYVEEHKEELRGPKGDDGNGILSTTLNDDYTLTINFTDGTSYTTPVIRGKQGEQGLKGDDGVSITSTVLNDDYTLTIAFSDGHSYTTPNIRGKQGVPGQDGYTPIKGIDYFDGKSVTIVEYVPSTEDDGFAFITFSDGTVIAIKNGSKGKDGTDATVTTESITRALGYTPVNYDDEELRKEINKKVNQEEGKGLFSGKYEDLSGKPTIPSKTSDLTNDSGFLTEHQSLEDYYKKEQVNDELAKKQGTITDLETIRQNASKVNDKQETLTSGVNIKTINNESILGRGNINVGSITDDEVPLLLDGTISTYRKVMKQWFLANGVKVVTSLGLTDLITRWYTITRDNWSGGVKFNQPTSTAGATGVSTGTAIGDNVGLKCQPSTDTVKGADDYEGLPLFAITDCNWAYDSDNMQPIITAIDGITDNFERDNVDKYVGVLQMTGYHSYDEDDNYYTHTYSANYESGHDECKPLPEAVGIYGDVRPFVVHAKYMANWTGQRYTCCAGVIPTAWQSHDIAVSRGKASGISGGCLVDYAFLKLMYHLKYKNLASDGVLQGCCNYNYQRYAIVSETNTNRVLLSSGRVSEFEVGSSVLIGAYSGNTDRNNSGCYNISGQSGRKVLKVENVNINGTTYTQVVVDGNPFNTVASTSDTTATTGATIISSFHYETGYCDSVLGNDGSPKNVTSGKYPARLQGIEYAVGGYEVFADTIQNHNGTEYEVYTCDRLANQGTSISTHKASGLKIPMPASNNWYYPKKWGYKDGIFYPTVHGTSSSQFLKDGFYMLGTGQTGTKEFLSFGDLLNGSAHAGLSCLSGINALSSTYWSILVRLSPNSNRGEFVA